MTESWRQRLRREAREMDAALRSLFAAVPATERALLDRLEQLARAPYFAEFTWFWGPLLAERNRILFRPFILSHFSGLALNVRGEFFQAWDGATRPPLERWLAQVDAADDVELTRRLYGWSLERTPWKERPALWRSELIRRFSAATSRAARFTALAKVDTGGQTLDAKTAVALYEIDAAAASPFILAHLPWQGFIADKKREDWSELLSKSRERDAEFHFDLYRRIVEEKRWRADVLELCRELSAPDALDAELERRHPQTAFASTAEVFLEIMSSRGADVVPYVLRHVSSISPRWGGSSARDAKGLPALLDLCAAKGWFDLWGALLRTAATRELFDGEVKRLVRSTTLQAHEVRRRLSSIAGHGREAHWAGASLAQVQPLEEDTALELYERFPELVRGPYRIHVAPGWHAAYPKLARRAIEAGDLEFVDYLASRAGIQTLSWGDARGWKEALNVLCEHFESLADAEFVRRASDALSRMPAFAVWNYEALLRSNRLARLLFERSTALYLSNAAAVRDLLESPQIHVQALAFRILGRDDPRARVIAAQNVDLLQATLFRPLHRRTRLAAFKALERAAQHEPATAQYLLGRMREALALPERRYPVEKLIGLMGQVLHRWPALRSAAEVPVVYGEAPAEA